MDLITDFANINTFDLIVITVVLISTLLSLFKGFFFELLTLFTWIVAFIAAYIAGPILLPVTDQVFATKSVSEAFSYLLVFFGALIGMFFIGSMIKAVGRDFRGGFLDRFLGGFFGIFRGYLIMIIAFLVIILPYPALQTLISGESSSQESSQVEDKVGYIADSQGPEWITKSKSYPYLKYGGDFVLLLVPDRVIKKSEDIFNKLIPQNASEPSEQPSEE